MRTSCGCGQLAVVVGALALALGTAFAVAWPLAGFSADQPANASTALKSPASGTFFTPTKEQWAGLETQTVEARQFRSERVTEGNVALDDDLNTPVFSPYSGRVVELIASLGAHVERGAPLLKVEATEGSSRGRNTC